MALIDVAFDDGGYLVGAPGLEPLRLPRELESRVDNRCEVRVWNDTVEATLADPDTNIWFSEYLGFACGLVYLAEDQHRPVPNPTAGFDDEVGFADAAPVLLISEASLLALNAKLERPVAMERFRPNLVVEGCEPHAEDGWLSVTIDAARLEVAWPCSRCILTTVDPETGVRDADGEPLRTLGSYRRRERSVYFGQNLIPRAPGTIRVGADCAIEETTGT
jgi:hypothetical protein